MVEEHSINNTAEMYKKRFLVPVRKIPLMAKWGIDEVFKILLNRPGIFLSDAVGRTGPLLVAYELDTEGGLTELLPEDWRRFACFRARTEDVYQNQEPNDGREKQFEDLYHGECLQKIPPNLFVWSDDLMSAHSVYFSEENMSIINEEPGDRSLRWGPPLCEDTELIGESYALIGKEYMVESVTTENENPFLRMTDLKWKDITITIFTDGISVVARDESFEFDLASLGLERKKGVEPKILWRFFRKLGEKGHLKKSSNPSEWARGRKMVSNLRKVLFSLTSISKEDPFFRRRPSKTWEPAFQLRYSDDPLPISLKN